MVPVRQNSDTSELSASTEADHGSDLGTVSPLDSPLISPEPSPSHGPVSRSYDIGGTQGGLGHLELEDLDLLPTKEISSKSPHFDMQGQTYSRTCQNGKDIQNCSVHANRCKYVEIVFKIAVFMPTALNMLEIVFKIAVFMPTALNMLEIIFKTAVFMPTDLNMLAIVQCLNQ